MRTVAKQNNRKEQYFQMQRITECRHTIQLENNSNDLPIVSIECLTYNQEKYIAAAIESFLMQETTFPFEIIIHDDASTDGTAEIIKAYADRFPDKIIPILEPQNLYSSNLEQLRKNVNERIRGKYVAYCEGDDYWTDTSKLQKQYEAMEKFPEIDICAHAVEKVNASTLKKCGFIRPEKKDCIIPVERVIEGGGEFVGTNSLFIRREALKQECQFRKMYKYDYTLQVNYSLRGGMLYLKDCMSAYRVMAENSWSRRVRDHEDTFIQFRNMWMKMLNQMNTDTKGEYQKAIENYTTRFAIDSAFILGDYTTLREYRYMNYYKELIGTSRFKYYLKVRFPRMFESIKKKLQ